jgi:hypothetical protein
MSYIDCEKCIHYQICCGYTSKEAIAETNRAMNNGESLLCFMYTPTADVVEVVRCKDCQHWDREHIKLHTRSSEDDTLVEFAECEQWSDWAKCRMTRYDDYCSCCERREE